VSIAGAAGYAREMIDQGDEAPDFELPDQDGREVKLSSFRGQPVVAYFYPKADTPGTKATKMAQDLPLSTIMLLA
jgi:peroxiredoxin